MKTNFDERKTNIEKLIDKAISAMERTHPEQTTDAMTDYVKILRILSPVSKDPRIKPIVDSLRKLYIYPTRSEHNEVLIEIHEVKEFLHEQRIHNVLSEKRAGKVAVKSLGNTTVPKSTIWIIMLIASILYLIPK